MRMREIPLSKLSLTGQIPSNKNKYLVSFESSLERDFIFSLEFDPFIEKYQEQPIKIPYINESGKSKNYIPDFLVFYHQLPNDHRTSKPILCEIKYLKDLKMKENKLKNKFIAAYNIAKANNWLFRIYTERDIRTSYLNNARFLYSYIKMDIQKEKVELILDTLYELRETDPESLLLAMYRDPVNRAKILPTIWHMIAHRIIGVDLTLSLTMKSRIWTTF